MSEGRTSPLLKILPIFKNSSVNKVTTFLFKQLILVQQAWLLKTKWNDRKPIHRKTAIWYCCGCCVLTDQKHCYCVSVVAKVSLTIQEMVTMLLVLVSHTLFQTKPGTQNMMANLFAWFITEESVASDMSDLHFENMSENAGSGDSDNSVSSVNAGDLLIQTSKIMKRVAKLDGVEIQHQ